MHGQIDGYSEAGAFGLNLAVAEQTFESLQSVVGAQMSYAFSQSFGVVIPQVNVGWHHECLNHSRSTLGKYTSDPRNNFLTAGTRDFAYLGAGVSSVFAGGIQAFFNYETILGYDRVTSHGFTAGVRMEF